MGEVIYVRRGELLGVVAKTNRRECSSKGVVESADTLKQVLFKGVDWRLTQ